MIKFFFHSSNSFIGYESFVRNFEMSHNEAFTSFFVTPYSNKFDIPKYCSHDVLILSHGKSTLAL